MARRKFRYKEPLPKPRSKKEFAAMLYNLFGFLPPAVAVCEGHTAPLDVLWKVYNQEHMNYIIVAARKSGKTMGIAALQVLFALTYERLSSCDVAAKLSQAEVCYEHSRAFLFAPKGEIGKRVIPQYIVDEGTKREIQLRTGSRIFIATGSIKGVNAIHPHKLFFDEVELLDGGWSVIQEALPAPMTEGDKLRQICFVSSWKFRGGILDRLIATFRDDPTTYIAFWCGFEAMQPVHDCSFCHSLQRKLSDGTVVSFADFCKNKDGSCKGKRARGFISLVDVRSEFLGLDENVFRSQWLSERPQESGLRVFYIHPSSRIKRYIPLPEYPLYAGVDYGRVSAVVVCQVLPTGHIVVFDEFVRYNLSPREVARLCAEISAAYKRQYGARIELFVIDPRHFYIFEREFAELGLPAVAPPNPAYGGSGEKKARVNIVNNFLVPDFDTGIPKLLFVPSRVPVLLTQMEDLTYKTNSDGLPTDEIPDGNDHCSDALLYVVSYIYAAGINKEMEGVGSARPETNAILAQLMSNVERAPADDSNNDEWGVREHISTQEQQTQAAKEEVISAIKNYISNTMRYVAAQMNVPTTQVDIDAIAEQTYKNLEDYFAGELGVGKDITDIVYKMPKEVEQKLLELTVRELDRLQMRAGLQRWDSMLPYEMLHDALMNEVFGRGGGGGFTPPFFPPI